MGIYIPGIKLPKDEPGAFQVIVLYVGADGKLRAECDGTHEVAVVPPHGRLIDADALRDNNSSVIEINSPDGTILSIDVAIIDAAPTIIPAEPFNNLSKPCKDDIPICTKASPASLGIYKKAEEGET